MEMKSTDTTIKKMKTTGTDAIIVGDINQLPEECVSYVISLTTPRDACVSSAVSRDFRSAADSDATWEHFLPSDYSSFLSQSVDPVPVEYASKKELYFRLCDHPLLIDDGFISFGLDKSSGAKCFMLSARALTIVWGDNTDYWEWISLPDSRFSECAELKEVCWLELGGRIDSRILTPNTAYAAYLVFKLADNAWGLSNLIQTTKITLAGDIVSEHSVCVDHREREMSDDVRLPRKRQDGWLEVELGEFDSGEGIDGEVDVSFLGIKGGNWKNGLIVQGIEVRPKH